MPRFQFLIWHQMFREKNLFVRIASPLAFIWKAPHLLLFGQNAAFSVSYLASIFRGKKLNFGIAPPGAFVLKALHLLLFGQNSAFSFSYLALIVKGKRLIVGKATPRAFVWKAPYLLLFVQNAASSVSYLASIVMGKKINCRNSVAARVCKNSSAITFFDKMPRFPFLIWHQLFREKNLFVRIASPLAFVLKSAAFTFICRKCRVFSFLFGMNCYGLKN